MFQSLYRGFGFGNQGIIVNRYINIKLDQVTFLEAVASINYVQVLSVVLSGQVIDNVLRV